MARRGAARGTIDYAPAERRKCRLLRTEAGKAQWHLRAIHEYADAGFDHVYVHQIGHDQEGFFRFYEREVLPKL